MKQKKIGKIFAIGVVVLLTALVFSSNGLAMTESTTNNNLTINDQTRDLCYIYGWATYMDGSPAVGVDVNISQYHFDRWDPMITVTTVEGGAFEYVTYLPQYTRVRCESIGVVKERYSAPIMCFHLYQQIPIRNPYDMNNEPIGDL